MTLQRRTTAFIFRCALRLYPNPFRAAYGEEMLAVHRSVMAAAEPTGASTMVRVWLREVAWVVIEAIRAHLNATGKEPAMNTSNGVWWMALGLVVISVVAHWPVDTLWHTSMWLGVLGGVLGGWLLSRGSARARVGPYLLIGVAASLAAMLSRWVAAIAFGPGSEDNPWALLSILASEVLGLAVTAAALIGALDRDGRLAARLALHTAGGVFGGVLIGLVVSFAGWGLIQAIDSYRPAFNGTLSAWVGAGGQVLLGLIFPGIAALFGGAALGRAGHGSTRRMAVG